MLACLAALASAALLTPGGASAQAVPSAEYLGVNVQPLIKDTSIPESRWSTYLAPLDAGELRVNRLDINWRLVEHNAPVGGVHRYDWNHDPGTRSSIDFQLAAMLRHGLRPQPVFTAPPPWALRYPEAVWVADYAEFIAAFSERYGPGGSFWAEHPRLPKLAPVDYEIWNEANSNHWWTGKADAVAYARMLKVVYPRVKASAPWARIHLSIGWPDAAGYVGSLFAQGAGADFDGVAFHPYAPTAPAMLALITAMRTTLVSLGRPATPMLVNETGQPASYSGPGSLHAYAGPVNDATRAATQSLTADALARSDCGVEQFSVYAITGSETNREPIGEGFMGVLRYTDGTPNATGAALQRASLRWVAAVRGGNPVPAGQLALCSAADSPPQALLPLGIGVEPITDACLRGAIDYDGNPLEQSTLRMVRPDGRASEATLNATGVSELCVAPGPPITTVDVVGSVAKVAQSATFRCRVPFGPGACTQLPAAEATRAAPAPPTCTVKLSAPRPERARRGNTSTTKVRATLRCEAYRSIRTVKKKVWVKTHVVGGRTVALPRKRWKRKTMTVQETIQPKFVAGYLAKPPKSWQGQQRQRARKEVRLRTITLRHGQRVTFSVRRQIRKGDQVILTHALNPKLDKLPRVTVSVVLKAPRKSTARQPKQ